ncbi:unnamed protein product [Prunus armeniaca]|uniref:Uncharacterized protein n=1 Tax=Prunus armeniaca TaxID=36596 RepID=A0A6J5VQV4_PRUAR|nr:unnamed protein product [Prunus armeniaca]
MLVQEGRGEKACTSAHVAVAAAARAPEWCSKNFFRLDQGGVGKACTKVVAAPESCSKDFSGLIKITKGELEQNN